MSIAPQTNAALRLAQLHQSGTLPAPVKPFGLSAAQTQCVQKFQRIPHELPLPLRGLSAALSHDKFALGVRYPLDARVLTAPPNHESAQRPPIVLVGVGQLWALGESRSWDVVGDLLTHFDRFALPSWNFQDHPHGTRMLFSGACRAYYDGFGVATCSTGERDWEIRFWIASFAQLPATRRAIRV